MPNDNFFTGLLQSGQQDRQQENLFKQKMMSQIFLAQIKEKMKAQMHEKQLEAYKELVGRDGAGKFKFSLGPSGITMTPVDLAQQVKNLEARELLGQAGYGQRQQPSPQPSPSFPQQPSGGIPNFLQTGQPTGQPIRLPTAQPTAQPNFGGGILGARTQSKIAEKKIESRINAKSEVLKLSEKARANFGRSISLFQQITAQLKGKSEEQGGLGLIPGVRGLIATKTKRPGFGRTAGFLGQQRETAIGLNSILTGQNRVIRSVVKMIQETLPDEFDPQDMAAAKMAQSIKNAYKLVKSFEKAGLSPDVLRKMNPSELNKIDDEKYILLITEELERKLKSIQGNEIMTICNECRLWLTFRFTKPHQSDNPCKCFNRLCSLSVLPVSDAPGGQHGRTGFLLWLTR